MAMNVFVLSTGRCGSLTFVRACEHMTNYTSRHESRWGRLDDDRLAFPDRHIESDNRLSWMLGRLERAYGDDAFYVHLVRDAEAVAESFLRRWDTGIIGAYTEEILAAPTDLDVARRRQVCLDYVNTVNANITAFLADKSQRMTMHVENAAEEFPVFWERIGAEGDLEAAVAEFEMHHNASDTTVEPALTKRAIAKVARVAKGLPHYIAEA
jgi:hypothetical protein